MALNFIDEQKLVVVITIDSFNKTKVIWQRSLLEHTQGYDTFFFFPIDALSYKLNAEINSDSRRNFAASCARKGTLFFSSIIDKTQHHAIE